MSQKSEYKPKKNEIRTLKKTRKNQKTRPKITKIKHKEKL